MGRIDHLFEMIRSRLGQAVAALGATFRCVSFRSCDCEQGQHCRTYWLVPRWATGRSVGARQWCRIPIDTKPHQTCEPARHVLHIGGRFGIRHNDVTLD